MINREMISITATQYTSAVDEYGQSHTTVAKTVTIEGMPKVYSQTQVNNPKYVEVALVLLTKADLDSTYHLTIDGAEYGIVDVVPTSRYNRVLLKRYV